ADGREVVAAVDEDQRRLAADVLDGGEGDVAGLVSGADVDAVIAGERVAEDADRSRLPVQLLHPLVAANLIVERGEERAVIEEAHAPVQSALQVEVEKIEIRERRHRVEGRDEAA